MCVYHKTEQTRWRSEGAMAVKVCSGSATPRRGCCLNLNMLEAYDLHRYMIGWWAATCSYKPGYVAGMYATKHAHNLSLLE